MNRRLFAIFVLATAFGASGCSNGVDSSYAGFIPLLAKPQSYNGMELAIEGYMSRDRSGQLRLWLSKEIAESNRLSESIRVEDTRKQFDKCLNASVRLIGTFNASGSSASHTFKPVRAVDLSEIRDGRVYAVRCDMKAGSNIQP